MCLHEKGDAIADDVLRYKSKRESEKLSELAQYLYWTEVGREGALEFEKQVRQGRMAAELVKSMGNGMSVEKAQKMIRKSVEVQDKADAARSAKWNKARQRANQRPAAKRGGRPNPPRAPNNRNQQRPAQRRPQANRAPAPRRGPNPGRGPPRRP